MGANFTWCLCFPPGDFLVGGRWGLELVFTPPAEQLRAVQTVGYWSFVFAVIYDLWSARWLETKLPVSEEPISDRPAASTLRCFSGRRGRARLGVGERRASPLTKQSATCSTRVLFINASGHRNPYVRDGFRYYQLYSVFKLFQSTFIPQSKHAKIFRRLTVGGP